jgi:ATP-dependent helicase/nuclease subunit A
VQAAAAETGLRRHLADAERDVARALSALRAEGLLDPGVELRVEYPLAGAGPGAGSLLAGYADLVAAAPGRIDVVEIKTDAPPTGDVAAELPQYAAQARTYAELLARAGLAADRRIRCGLLFTAEGRVRWL